MKLYDAVAAFVDDVAGWKINETPKSYKAKLRRLVEYYPSRPLSRITTDDLNHFKRDLCGRCSPYTVKSVLSTVRHFFKWANENHLIRNDPALKLHIPMPPPPNPKAIDRDTVDKLINAASLHGEAWETSRNVAIIYWLRDTGGRSSGLITATLSGLDIKTGKCSVIEKGREVMLYLNKPAQEALKIWLEYRHLLDPVTDHIFISHKTHEGLKREGLRHIILTLARDAGISSRCNPHSFRHAFARDCLQSGLADLSQVSQLLHHRTVAITAAYYARWDDRELKQIHQRASPGGKLKSPNDA